MFLLQKQPDETDRPIIYWSCSLNDPKSTYNTTHTECLAVVWALLLLRLYLEGSLPTARTDHDALDWELNTTDCTVISARWRLRLFEFESDVVHHAGIKHQPADELLHLKTTRTNQTPIKNEIPVLCSTALIPPPRQKRRGEIYVYAEPGRIKR